MADLPFRLAIRKEGNFVNAYLAGPANMNDAMLLGSLLLGIAKRPDLFERWKALMTDTLAAALTDVFGVAHPTFVERRAPENERSGHG